MHENRETSGVSGPVSGPDRREKAEGRNVRMYALEESDCAVVPMKASNKTERSAAEGLEERAQTNENVRPAHTPPTQSGKRVSQGLAGVRQVAQEKKKEKFTALLHHLTVELLRQSFYDLQRTAAPGVDGVTWREYETGLEDRLIDLHRRVHDGTYRARPSRRVYIPKADGRQRPLGVAALEDKIVQQAVVTILNAIYEEDFLGFSYGFRPGRQPHYALDALSVAIVRKQVKWVLDCDIRGFFDNLSHEWLLRFIQHRIADRRIVRLIQKWLKAGVSEEGQWTESPVGTPQGAVVSPLAANIYLHYALDLWVEAWRKQAHGDVFIVRYADDFVMGFQHRAEAIRFQKALQERLLKFGLELHPDKTRLIEFGRYAESDRRKRGEGKPETFDFLGFTHMCGKLRKNGAFTVRRQTSGKKMRAKLKAIKEQLQRRRHDSNVAVGAWLRLVVQGYFNYHAVPGNSRRLQVFRRGVARHWQAVLRRRGSHRRATWERVGRLVDRWLPPVRILQPYPRARFDAMHRR
jgi:RNA-directed DNA polymerase